MRDSIEFLLTSHGPLIHVKCYLFLVFLSKVIEYQSDNLSSLLTFDFELFEQLISENIFN